VTIASGAQKNPGVAARGLGNLEVNLVHTLFPRPGPRVRIIIDPIIEMALAGREVMDDRSTHRNHPRSFVQSRLLHQVTAYPPIEKKGTELARLPQKNHGQYLVLQMSLLRRRYPFTA